MDPSASRSISPVLVLPDELRARLDPKIEARAVVGWSEFDLDDKRMFATQYAVLTNQSLHIIHVGGTRSLPLATIKEVATDELVGSDRLVLLLNDEGSELLRYTRKCRRDMSRLRRLIERRMPKDSSDADKGVVDVSADARSKDSHESRPEWLEQVEMRAAQKQVCETCRNSIPDYAEGVCPRCLQKRKILSRLLDVAKPYRAKLVIALTAMLFWTLLMAMVPVVSAGMVTAITTIDGPGLLKWGLLSAGLVVLTELLGGVRLYFLSGVGTLVARDLRHKVYAHMHDLSLRYFAKRKIGSLITRVTSDTDRLWDFIVFGSVDFFRNIFMIVAVCLVLAIMSWPLALISLIPIPIVLAVTWFRTRRIHGMFRKLWSYYSRMSGVVGDTLPGVRVVKAFSNEKREIDRFEKRSREYMDKELEVNRTWTMLQPIVGGTMRMGSLVVWVVGGAMHIWYPQDPRFSVALLVAFSGALWMFYGPIMEIANSGRMVSRAATSAQRVFEVLDTPPDIYSRADAVIKPDLSPSVEFRNVSFSYEGAQPALRDVSLKIEPGKMIGLCGHSGAGKSTFVNLICRFYDVIEGQVLIDDTDVRDYDVNWLRRQIGVVLQEPYLFAGTIDENIRYGKNDATPDQVIAAARAANAHDFIVGLPDGYDTIVGERGQSLSGGERQRISIARAILHDPKILILDEATSSVDTRTERAIQEALDRLVKGRTTFAIAHRLSTLQKADLLVVLDKGKIVESGTHAQLLEKPEGHFAKLHKMQAELSSLVAV